MLTNLFCQELCHNVFLHWMGFMKPLTPPPPFQYNYYIIFHWIQNRTKYPIYCLLHSLFPDTKKTCKCTNTSIKFKSFDYFPTANVGNLQIWMTMISCKFSKSGSSLQPAILTCYFLNVPHRITENFTMNCCLFLSL